VGLVGVAVVALAGVGLWYARSLPRPVEVRVGPGEGGGEGGSTVPGATPASPGDGGPPLIVHVAGWVRHPGVYELHQGDRVIDAIEAAGGPRRGAYLDALNLAAPLADGQQVLVPKRTTASGGSAPPPAGVPGGGSGGSLVNVNTASTDELESLPGIGEVIAQRIVDHRTEHGPFVTVDDLLDVSGIGEVTLEEIRDLVTV
jgi:competence protein ComEA